MTFGWSEWTMVVIFITTIVFLIKFSHKSITVFSSAMLACLVVGFVDISDVLNSASNQGLITLIFLIIISYSLEKTNWLRRVSNFLLAGSERFATVKLFITGALASSLINNTAVVATLLHPIRSTLNQSYSRLLIPLSFASIAGGTVTLIGTSTNLIVDSMLIEKTGVGFSFFEFSKIGLSVSVAVFIVVLLMQRSLPVRMNSKNNERSYMLEAEILSSSTMKGKTIEENGLRNLDGLFLVEIVRDDELISPVSPTENLKANDKLIFSGDVKNIGLLSQFDGLEVFSEAEGLLKENLTEVLIRPNSVLVGNTLKKSSFRSRFNAAVVAIRRDGQSLSGKLGEIKLEVGDLLVLAVSSDFYKKRNIAKNFIIVSGYEQKSFITGNKEKWVYGSFIGSIAICVLADIPLLTGLFVNLAFLLAIDALTLNEIKRRFPIEILTIVTSALVIAKSLENSGLLPLLSEQVGVYLEGLNAVYVLAVVYVLTWLLTELVTNNAAAALMFPIAYSLATTMGLPIQPFIYAVVFAASCSFISPYGYQTNLIVFNTGEYRLKEFSSFGLPVALVYSGVVLSMLFTML